MLLLMDNFDSFTYNLFHYLSEPGEEVWVARNDKVSLDEIEKRSLLSPPGGDARCLARLPRGYCLDKGEHNNGTAPSPVSCRGRSVSPRINYDRGG